RARRAADRRLVDVDDLVELLCPEDRIVRPDGMVGHIVRTVSVLVSLVGAVADAVALLESLLQDVVDQRRFARATDTRDADEETERELDIDVLEVVVACSLDGDALAVAGAALWRDRYLLLPGEVLPGERLLAAEDLVVRSGDDDLATAHARSGAEVHDVV